MKFLMKTVLKGLVVVVPIGVTLYVIWWLGTSAEALLGPLIRPVLPADGALRYRPGLGVVAALVVIFAIGLLTYSMLFRRLVDLLGKLMARVPGVKTVYGAVRDLMDMMTPKTGAKRAGQVVLVKLADRYPVIGLVTQSDSSQIPPALTGGQDDCVAVYMPMSYQVGGYTLFIPRSQTEPVDMTVEQAMRFALTAGLSRGQDEPAAPLPPPSAPAEPAEPTPDSQGD